MPALACQSATRLFVIIACDWEVTQRNEKTKSIWIAAKPDWKNGLCRKRIRESVTFDEPEHIEVGSRANTRQKISHVCIGAEVYEGYISAQLERVAKGHGPPSNSVLDDFEH